MAKLAKKISKVKKAIETDIIVEDAINSIKEPNSMKDIVDTYGTKVQRDSYLKDIEKTHTKGFYAIDLDTLTDEERYKLKSGNHIDSLIKERGVWYPVSDASDEIWFKTKDKTPFLPIELIPGYNLKKPETYNSPIIGELISQVLVTKQFICSSVVSKPRGAKLVNFYYVDKNSYDKSKPVSIYFDAGEPCLFESGKKYNFIISEV